ncbi:MAG: alpha/beta hydrolase [Alphaproteobacteria bacterium]|nr:alpha/beta hydrolase [Alphaproteobacteria bacterium]
MTEFVVAPDGVRIAFEIVGEGEPIVLVHGFGSDRRQNWRIPGWYETLGRAGYSVIALDCRGHGESGKPHDSAAYDEHVMASDAALVLDAAGHERACIMGYSMGGAIALRFAHEHPQRIKGLVTGGVGATYFTRNQQWRIMIADGLLAEDVSLLSPVQRMFRDFASQSGKDRLALAACMRAPRFNMSRDDFARISSPALVVCGETDEVSGPPEPLASALGNAHAILVPKRDHMLTVGDKMYKQAVIEFLGSLAR